MMLQKAKAFSLRNSIAASLVLRGGGAAQQVRWLAACGSGAAPERRAPRRSKRTGFQLLSTAQNCIGTAQLPSTYSKHLYVPLVQSTREYQ
jgi:hypothetical protein